MGIYVFLLIFKWLCFCYAVVFNRFGWWGWNLIQKALRYGNVKSIILCIKSVCLYKNNRNVTVLVTNIFPFIWCECFFVIYIHGLIRDFQSIKINFIVECKYSEWRFYGALFIFWLMRFMRGEIWVRWRSRISTGITRWS